MNGLQYALELIDRNFGVGIRKAKAGTKGLDDAVGRTNRNIAKVKVTGERSFGGLGNIARRVAPMVAGVFAIGSAIAFGNEITRVTSQFEGFENAIAFASGQDGGQNIRFLDSEIKTLNLDMASSYKGFQKLTGSMKGTSLEGQGVRDIFDGVATAATVMNLTAEQSEGAFLALSQMASKGKVQAEELRGQLGERIPGAFKIAADAMGVTQGKLNEMLDTGEVYSEDFLPKFAKQLKSVFGDGLAKAATSVQSAINRKNNALLSFKRVSGEAFRPLITGTLEAGTVLFGFASELVQNLKPVKEALGVIWTAMKPVRDSFAASFAPISAFGKAGVSAAGVMEYLGAIIEKAAPVVGFLSEIFAYMQIQVLKVSGALWEAISGLNESGAAGEFLTNVMHTLAWVWELIKPAISVVYDILAETVKVIFAVVGSVMTLVNAMFEWGRQTEWVQRLLNALAGTAASVFKHIKEVAMNVLGSVGDLLVGIFTFDVDMIKSGLAKGFDAITGAFDTVDAVVNGAVEGWNKKLEAPISKNIKVSLQEQQSEASKLNGSSNGLETSLNGDDNVVKAGNDRATVAGSGKSEKHTTFNIQSFVKELTIQTTNLKDNPADIKRMITQIFNEAVADLELRANA
jgi:tape measure domain-containing protein